MEGEKDKEEGKKEREEEGKRREREKKNILGRGGGRRGEC